MTSADAPATTPPTPDSPELDAQLVGELTGAIVAAEDFDTEDAEAAARAALAWLGGLIDVATDPVPDWYVRLDGLVNSDAFPMAVREDVGAALRKIAALHLVAARAWRERDGALRGAQRALLAQRDATDALALALLKADDSLTPQHPAEEVAALKEAARAARAVVDYADDHLGVVGNGDDVMMRLAQSLAAVER
jgi:hypothetical protein